MLKHQQDRLQMEDAQNQEYQQFNQEWDNRIGAKEQDFAQQIGGLEQKHQEELERNRAEL